ncbi:hypothetical protein N7530_003838 [Penicillium desertorum]|jgi:hypothetical protein|uniref:Uncharacterized protein n=1 Tax=Penicillium desertorum TaxID=1303715 RepID=A0A9W9WX14_9EURO|nr:hypothetical protein N7530_003838 [Penicillium desertorum]
MAALVFLRVLPLLTTSSYLTFTIAEDLYFKPYLEPSVAGAADHLLPSYITVWYNRGMVLIFTIYPLTWCTAIANLPVAHLLHTSIAAFVLYLLGLLFSIAHMLWGPHAMNLLNSIKKQDSSGSTEIVRRWCRMNLIRGALVDVPAWGCFLAGFLVWESAR